MRFCGVGWGELCVDEGGDLGAEGGGGVCVDVCGVLGLWKATAGEGERTWEGVVGFDD